MSISATCRVEFLGGPLDGYNQFMTISLDPFLGVMVFAEHSYDGTNGILAGFSRVLGTVRPKMVPLAVYELQDHGDRQAHYRYVRSCVVSSKSLQSGHGLKIDHVSEASK